MGQRSWNTGPGPICLMVSGVGSPWAWRNWLSAGAASSRFAVPPILPPPVWYTCPGPLCLMANDVRSPWAWRNWLSVGSLYAYGIIKVGRNALAFLGNAAFKHRLRTAWGSVHGILCPGPLCLRTYHVRSPWAWSRPSGPVPSTLMVYCAQGLYV